MPLFPLGPSPVFPDPEAAEPTGLLALGGDLRVERLLAAYRAGIFPWYGEGEPLLWWSPPLRALFCPGDEHLSRRTRRALRGLAFEIRWDGAFDAVVQGCRGASRPGQEGTWITLEVAEAYGALHREGYAHSVEAWMDGELAGGLYGVSLGAAFFGESMFSRRPYASRAAFAALCARLWAEGFLFIDGQVQNPNLAQLGARELPREAFLSLLGKALEAPTRRGSWGG